MCSKATCHTCGKTTWSGCGNHVKQVMQGVPADKQCTCGTHKATAGQPTATTAPAGGPTAGRLRSLFRRS